MPASVPAAMVAVLRHTANAWCRGEMLPNGQHTALAGRTATLLALMQLPTCHSAFQWPCAVRNPHRLLNRAMHLPRPRNSAVCFCWATVHPKDNCLWYNLSTGKANKTNKFYLPVKCLLCIIRTESAVLPPPICIATCVQLKPLIYRYVSICRIKLSSTPLI